MKPLLILAACFSLIQCKPDDAKQSANPCLEYEVPVDWVCEERIGFDFCFPSTYESLEFLWKNPQPYAHLSKGIFNGHEILAVDSTDFITIPFPDEISLIDEAILDIKIELCDDGELIGVYYYGDVVLDNMFEYVGVLYLKTDPSDSGFYLSAYSNMEEAGLEEMLDVVQRIRKHE